MPLLAIASITFREAVRRKLVLAVSLLSVVVMGLSLWGLYRLHFMAVTQGHPSQSDATAAYAILVILLAQMFSFVLAVGAAFLAAPAIAGDVESGVALVILPRPVRRSDMVLGKWLGLCVLLTAYVYGAGGFELLGVHAVTGYVPPHPVVALSFVALQTIVLLTLALWFGTRLAAVTGGVIALVLYGVAWIAQVAGAVALLFRNEGLVHACTVVSLLVPTGVLWRGAAFALEPVLVAMASATVGGANPFTAASPPTPAFMIWTAAWLVGVLVLAVTSFNSRDV